MINNEIEKLRKLFHTITMKTVQRRVLVYRLGYQFYGIKRVYVHTKHQLICSFYEASEKYELSNTKLAHNSGHKNTDNSSSDRSHRSSISKCYNLMEKCQKKRTICIIFKQKTPSWIWSIKVNKISERNQTLIFDFEMKFRICGKISLHRLYLASD